jgi:CubicO group peptidase (beta-lactamase class C family)
LLAVFLPGAGQPPPAPDPATIDRYLTSSLAALGFPGAAVAVTRGGEVVYERGFGAAGADRQIGVDARFRLASLSKSFTAVGILQLVADGRLDLDAPVRAYLPEFTTADPAATERITVRHLLNQTSGLSDAGFSEVNEPVADLEARVRSLRTARPVSEPGREFHYFDPNYQLLARLLEVVSGLPYATYLRERVFVPLGMRDTVAVDMAADAARAAPDLAQGHVMVFGVPVARPELGGLLAGSGGVISTARDMARWLVLHTTGAGPEGQRVLDPALLALTHTPPAGVPGGYGMGWQVGTDENGPLRVEHTGILATFSAVQVLLPESDYAFVLLYNANSALVDTAGVTAGLIALLVDGRAGGGPRNTMTVAVVLGALTVAIGGIRAVQIVRVVRYGARPRPRWRRVLGTAWQVLPLGLLLALPSLMLTLIDRRFTLWQLALSMPDVVVLLAVAAGTGVALAVARLAALSRAGRPGPPDGETG